MSEQCLFYLRTADVVFIEAFPEQEACGESTRGFPYLFGFQLGKIQNKIEKKWLGAIPMHRVFSLERAGLPFGFSGICGGMQGREGRCLVDEEPLRRAC